MIPLVDQYLVLLADMEHAERAAGLAGKDISDKERSAYVAALDVIWHAMTNAQQDETERRLIKRAS